MMGPMDESYGFACPQAGRKITMSLLGALGVSNRREGNVHASVDETDGSMTHHKRFIV